MGVGVVGCVLRYVYGSLIKIAIELIDSAYMLRG